MQVAIKEFGSKGACWGQASKKMLRLVQGDTDPTGRHFQRQMGKMARSMATLAQFQFQLMLAKVDTRNHIFKITLAQFAAAGF